MLAGVVVVVGFLLLPLDVIHATTEKITDGEGAVRRLLFGIVMSLTGWFVWFGGAILDFGVNSFVINFGINFNQNGVGEAVNGLWSVVRDFFNILFIFGLVYIGFKMILGSDDSNTKRNLVYLIMAALLINFSLFITKFVVDFTNVLASQVAIAGFQASNQEGTDVKQRQNGGVTEVAIGDTFFDLMDISPTVLQTPEGIENGRVLPWTYIFGSGIVNIVAAFAFGVGGIMLIIRFVALSVYMVLSPFMFLGWIFPGFQSMSSKYWIGFLKQAFYAPVYIVMIFFAATILSNFFGDNGSYQDAALGQLTGAKGVFGAAGGQAAAFGAGLAPFILSAAFLIAAVQVAGKLSADGSAFMGKIGGAVQSRARRVVGGAALGLPARGLRATVGAGANAYTNSATGRRLAANSTLGKYAFKASQKAANSSFDARRVGGVGKTMDIGEGSKTSYAKGIKDRGKAEDQFAKDIANDFDSKDPKSAPAIAAKVVELRSKKEHEKKTLAAAHMSTFEKYEDDIDALKEKIAKAGDGATDEMKIELQQQEAAYNAAFNAYEGQQDELDSMLDVENKRGQEKLRMLAVGQLKYANELAYVEQLKRSEQFFKGLIQNPISAVTTGNVALTGSGILGVTAGMAGVATGGAALATSVGMINSGNAAKAGYKAILKRTGEDGVKGLKGEETKKRLSALGEAMKENEDKPETKKGDSGDKQDKE